MTVVPSGDSWNARGAPAENRSVRAERRGNETFEEKLSSAWFLVLIFKISRLKFNLSFPALVTLYDADSTGNIVSMLNKPIRMMEGKQSLSLYDKVHSGKLVLVADGTVIGIQDMPKIPADDEKKAIRNKEEAP